MIVFGMDLKGTWHVTKIASADDMSRDEPVTVICQAKRKSMWFSATAESVESFVQLLSRLTRTEGKETKMCKRCVSINKQRLAKAAERALKSKLERVPV